jgi:hypothetical protein
MILAESSESRPSRYAVAARALTRRPRSRDGSYEEDGGGAGQRPAMSSNSSSNAAVRSRTKPHRLRVIAAGQLTARTVSDGLNRDRSRLLIRGFRVRAPSAPRGKTSLVDLARAVGPRPGGFVRSARVVLRADWQATRTIPVQIHGLPALPAHVRAARQQLRSPQPTKTPRHIRRD